MAQKQTGPERVEVPVEEPADDPSNWIRYDAGDQVEYYIPFTNTPSGTRGNHILRGRCDQVVEDEDGGEHVCGDDALVRRITDDSIEEYCGRSGHAPDAWLAALEGEKQLDDTLIDLRQTCEKQVVNHNLDGRDSLPDYTEMGDGNTIERPAAVHECGDRAFVLVSDGERWGKAFCRQHARTPWYRNLQLRTGDPTATDEYASRPGWPDDVEKDDCVWVDAYTGRAFESYVDWMEGVDDVYPDVISAEEHLVVLKSAGKPVPNRQ